MGDRELTDGFHVRVVCDLITTLEKVTLQYCK